MERGKVNLEKILSKELEGISLLSTSNAREVTLNAITRAMKEACRQVLVLGAKNAVIKYGKYDNDTVDKKSIINTINQVI